MSGVGRNVSGRYHLRPSADCTLMSARRQSHRHRPACGWLFSPSGQATSEEATERTQWPPPSVCSLCRGGGHATSWEETTRLRHSRQSLGYQGHSVPAGQRSWKKGATESPGRNPILLLSPTFTQLLVLPLSFVRLCVATAQHHYLSLHLGK